MTKKNDKISIASNKCSPAGWCRFMNDALEPEANARRKGLSVLLVSSLKGAPNRIVGVAFRKSASDQGVMLNVCPFCAASILWEKKP